MGIAAAVLCGCAEASGGRAPAARLQTLVVRGQPQALHIYGPPGGDPVVLSSGDGGWIHLAPHIAETLAARGSFVVGFDVKSYLTQFTASQSGLGPDDVARDYGVLLDFAAAGSKKRPVLVGVSEGAGLSVLAATDPCVRSAAAGVIGVGLPALTELGWRWRDALIYLTHGVPDEPTFSTASVIGEVAPLPVASIESSHDEFVSGDDAALIFERTAEPKRRWTLAAADHRFSDNLGELDTALSDAVGWVREQGTH
jgi:pimeloyl-ACP methyl ester carboxylesterase